jgi:hypothetical protein
MRFLFLAMAGFPAGLALWAGMAPMRAAGPEPAAAPNVGEFSAVKIDKRGVSSALDIRLDGKGRAVRFYAPEGKDPRTYFNDAGMLYTNGWMVISGVMTGAGDGYNIEPPTKDPSMLAVWSDVLGPAIQVRAANAGADSYLFQGLDRKAHYTISIEQDGGLRWGAASRKEMDTRLYRSAAKTLKTDGALVVADKVGIGTADPVSTLYVGGSQSVQRTAVAADYAVSDRDYYIGVTDTAARRTITLPTACERAGRVYVIKDESGGAATQPITVKAKAGETIDGAGTLTITANYGVVRVISSGKSWFGM